MRAIVINPAARSVTELQLSPAADLIAALHVLIGTDTLTIDAAPPHTALFLDGLGMMREEQAYWRATGVEQPVPVAGIAVLFGLAPDGRLADVPATISVETVTAGLEWVDDRITRRVETLVLVQTPNGPAPQVHRTAIWEKGAAIAPAKPEPPLTGPVPSDAAIHYGSIWSIHETDDGRYRVLEYEVTAAGLGPVASLSTVMNIDDARERIPKGLTRQEPGEDAGDDTLVETWS